MKNSSVGPRPVPASPKYSTSKMDLNRQVQSEASSCHQSGKERPVGGVQLQRSHGRREHASAAHPNLLPLDSTDSHLDASRQLPLSESLGEMTTSLGRSEEELPCTLCCSECNAREMPKAVQLVKNSRHSKGNKNPQVSACSHVRRSILREEDLTRSEHQLGRELVHSIRGSCSCRMSFHDSFTFTNSDVLIC